jgi:hypothetical protein
VSDLLEYQGYRFIQRRAWLRQIRFQDCHNSCARSRFNSKESDSSRWAASRMRAFWALAIKVRIGRRTLSYAIEEKVNQMPRRAFHSDETMMISQELGARNGRK